MSIKKLRTSLGLSQTEVSDLVDIPLRTYKNYENDPSKIGTIKYQYIVKRLEELGLIDEEHGILSIDQITKITKKIFEDYDIEYCYLFGSYAKGKPNQKSDVDLFLSTNVTGLKFY